jgi:hypothetical protein
LVRVRVVQERLSRQKEWRLRCLELEKEVLLEEATAARKEAVSSRSALLHAALELNRKGKMRQVLLTLSKPRRTTTRVSPSKGKPQDVEDDDDEEETGDEVEETTAPNNLTV